MAGESYEDQTPEDLAVPLQPEETEMQGAGGNGEKKWPGWPGENVFRILVPAQKVGTIIGPKGEFIRKISDESRARIKILDGPPTTSERAMQNVSVNQNMVVLQSQHHLHGSPIADSEALLGSKPKYMYPESQFDDFYEPHELPLHDKNSYQGPALYGKHGSMGGHASNVQAKQSVVTKIIQHMQIPLSYANAVIGTSGANISYMRRASGAAIAIQETRDVPGDMIVEISGSASEVQAAEQLIRNFIAEAANAMQSLPGGSISEEYSPYPVHASLYASSDANGHVSHATVIDHGSIYGTGYGY
ncbi:hypothetical protein ES319_A11G137600v1 [Gossypium barbadense]|uniref:K Homology domain-containing protein n=1 Tax=Gossypium barbadense TaxID=3634 RepID=A0A5J5TRZ3_GOSBA|nr:hypothetical protein ES319_A11G137600v1 [Gossypium barbadense]